ncbi:unnamed protein product [Acanthoscelides obtectus]|uniref:DUF4371 domain-containing protein n=1 Tax=Acanthoscelides obtectus TaxID=200917 RepID=A0A9P0MF53_ACAOB|nr:unnamed protein product [Acanthoscelides obtectus]CAK1627264.1 hypothetical protein AOBTE_LOCUS4448 [Acanthoscelides obtectus]
MLDVYHEEVKKEIANSPFVAVIADETTDVACEFQLVIIFRYLCKGQPLERFWRFYVPDGHDAKSIAACVLNVVNPLLDQNPNKLIAQSYDGASVMSDCQDLPKHVGIFSHEVFIQFMKIGKA